MVSVRRRLAQRGVRVVDAFRAMDADRDGRVCCSELYGGLEWLGVKVSPDDVYAIVRQVQLRPSPGVLILLSMPTWSLRRRSRLRDHLETNSLA